MSAHINSDYIPQIPKVFSKKVIKEILSTEKSVTLNEIITHSNIKMDASTTYASIYNDLYEILVENYRNEYIYKNEFLLSLIKKNYKKEHIFLQEVAVDCNVVDLLVINGKTTAYEIKTEYDSLQRLDSQLESYSKVFDNIFIITSENHLKKIEEFLENKYNHVGILIFSKKNIISYKKATKNSCISIQSLRGLLNFSELNEYNLTFEQLDKMNKVKAFKICRDILKRRQKNGVTVLDKIPYSIKSLIANLNLVSWQKEKIHNKLLKNITL